MAEHSALMYEVRDREWLTELFEYEYCGECGGDAEHHTVVPLLGNHFARCDYQPDDEGNWHPVVAAFRDAHNPD